MKKFLTRIGLGVGVFALPVLALAQSGSDIESLGSKVIDIINGTLVPLIFAAAFIVFIWGVFQYFILGASSDDGKDKGKDLMIYGLIGFFVMVSVWGIVNLVVSTFELDRGSQNINLPESPNVGS